MDEKIMEQKVSLTLVELVMLTGMVTGQCLAGAEHFDDNHWKLLIKLRNKLVFTLVTASDQINAYERRNNEKE